MADETSPPEAPTQKRRRRLRAALAADIANFSGRVSVNETSAFGYLSTILKVGREELALHDGTLIGMPGDGLFALFESAVDAVQCALAIQERLAKEHHLGGMRLRIGIHVGDVLFEGDMPFGETLNIAARLESLADPGGILVSGTMVDAVSARIQATFEDRGVPRLKNIPRRITTYAVHSADRLSDTDMGSAGILPLDTTMRLPRTGADAAAGAAPPAAPSTAAQSIPPSPRLLDRLPPDRSLPETTLPDPIKQPKPLVPPATPSPRAWVDLSKPLPPCEPPAASPLDTPAPVTRPADMRPADVRTAVTRPAVTPPLSTLDDTQPDAADLTATRPPRPRTQDAMSPQPAAPTTMHIRQSALPVPANMTPVSAPAPSAPSVPSAPTMRKSIGPDELNEITEALAVHLGPMARVVVNRKAGDAATVSALIETLAADLRSAEERAQFCSRLNKLIGR